MTHIKTDNNSIQIKDLDITVRAKTVLKALNVETIGDLYSMYMLDTLPAIGTTVKYVVLARTEVIYSKKVHEEVKDILHTYCRVDKNSIQ